jgi:hypothetical protein
LRAEGKKVREGLQDLRTFSVPIRHGTTPPLSCWAHLSAEEYRRRVAELVAEIEGQGALRRELLGQPAKGVAAVREQEPHAAPERLKKSPAPMFHAASKKIRRGLEGYKHFFAAFREAAERLRAGHLSAAPIGTHTRSMAALMPSSTA